MGSLGGICIEQNDGNEDSVVFSDQGTLAKVECHSSSISLFPIFVYFRYKIPDRWPGTKIRREGKISVLVCKSWMSGEVKGRNQLCCTQCFGPEALLSVYRDILQLTFLAGVCLVCTLI